MKKGLKLTILLVSPALFPRWKRRPDEKGIETSRPISARAPPIPVGKEDLRKKGLKRDRLRAFRHGIRLRVGKEDLRKKGLKRYGVAFSEGQFNVGKEDLRKKGLKLTAVLPASSVNLELEKKT